MTTDIDFTEEQRAWLLERSRAMHAETDAAEGEDAKADIAIRHKAAAVAAFRERFGAVYATTVQVEMDWAASVEKDPDLPRRITKRFMEDAQKYQEEAPPPTPEPSE